MKLPDLGVQPDVTYYYRRDPGARFALTFVHGGASPRGNEFAGEGGGAMLALGDGIPTPGTVASLDPLIEIAPVPRCRLQLQISGGYGSKCFGDLYVGVTGKPRFVRTFFAGFRIAERRRAALPRRN